MRKLGKYQRSVSIIGVGCTPWMRILDDPETEGLTENELFGYAALEAMKDAGVEGKDIQFYYHGQAMPIVRVRIIVPSAEHSYDLQKHISVHELSCPAFTGKV